jgi:cell wall-associated NlpC family hydrolase
MSGVLSRFCRRFSFVALFGVLSLLAGCGTTTFRDSGRPVGPDRRAVIGTAVAAVGTPYRYGGASPSTGFDCSGLAYYAHSRAARSIPRESAQQYRKASKRDPDDLTPGDLLFFETGSSDSHVGVYLGRGRFIHAPSSGRQVRTDSVFDEYWGRRFIGAGHFYGGDG